MKIKSQISTKPPFLKKKYQHLYNEVFVSRMRVTINKFS